MAQDTTRLSQEQSALREALSRLAEALSRPLLPPPRMSADVYEPPGGTTYVVEIPAPGLRSDEIKITVSGDMLTVEFQPHSTGPDEGRTYLVQELSRQPMARVFTFPTAIDPHHIQARLEGGMLRITVPKADGIPSHVIRVEEA
jgi:HSP20 family molecular chaperone IbpA